MQVQIARIFWKPFWLIVMEQYVSSPIHTYSLGLAASMGSLLLAAGEKGKRHCLPNASIMIHRAFLFSRSISTFRSWFSEPSGGASGQATDIAIHAKEILRIRQLLTGIYQRHCAKEGETRAEGMARFGKPYQITWVIYCWLRNSFRKSLGTRLLYDW